jgi:hypothetical protein
VMEKLQQAFRQLVHLDARRFWATFPGHGYVEGGTSQGFFWQPCLRDEQPNHPLSQEFF